MKILTRSFSLLLICFLVGCVDKNIEGLPVFKPFKATKATSTFTTLNGCSLSSGSNGTLFTMTIEYEGATSIYQLDITSYQFAGGTSGGPFYDVNFTSGGTTSKPSISFTDCNRFGSTSSLTYNLELTSTDFETSTISLTINKPAGAN